MDWFKQTLANVAGTQEPEYGPSAIQSVADQAEKTPYTELAKKDLRWKAMDSTCVETQTFYFMSDEGTVAMAQLIYSNVGGIRTTCQFNSKIFGHGGAQQHLWCSDPLNNYGFDGEHLSFFADNVAIILNNDGSSYDIKSAINEESILNLTVDRVAPGFKVGKDGTTYFGTDRANPWGSMRHAFWPRCTVEGTIKTKQKEYNMKGRAMFVMALQGMKPHHAAAKWNFINFQTPTYSAVMMTYTTPASYGRTTVNVGGVARDGEIIFASSKCTTEHTAASQDSENDWLEPKAVLCRWSGKNKDGQIVSAEIMGDLGRRADRIDVLSHIPGFVKTIVGGVVGTKPYIYQFINRGTLALKLQNGGNETSEVGDLYAEATFIS